MKLNMEPTQLIEGWFKEKADISKKNFVKARKLFGKPKE